MKSNKQSGQTLIETLAAVFVLAMGITAVVGLATFSLKSSTNVTKQVVGIGLARQGIEAIKNMRDTNWLRQVNIDTDCHNFKTSEETASCFRNWLTNSYDISGAVSPGANYVLTFNPDTGDNKLSGSDTVFWHLSAPPAGNYTLYYAPLSSGSKYFYDPSSSTGNPSGYYRKITIIQEGVSGPILPPFDTTGVGPYIRVISQVWWADKSCPTPSATAFPTTGSCRTSLETVLTNWKTN